MANLNVKELDEQAVEVEKKATDLKTELVAQGSSDKSEWEEEGVYKEKVKKIERHAMKARQEAAQEKSDKLAVEKRDKRMEQAEKDGEKKRKKDYKDLLSNKQATQKGELDEKTAALKELGQKKVEAQRLHFERMEKQNAADHRDKSRWLKIQEAEHSSKTDWANAQTKEV